MYGKYSEDPRMQDLAKWRWTQNHIFNAGKNGDKKKTKGKIQNQTVTGQLAAWHHEAPGTKSKDKLTIIEGSKW